MSVTIPFTRTTAGPPIGDNISIVETTTHRSRERSGKSGDIQTQPIVILGMHRSGTSCLAGSLQERGLHLGQVYEWRPFNLKGNRENQRIMDVNNAVLEQSDGSWDHPPRELRWDRSCADERDTIVRELRDGSEGAWGFKDPRTLLTLPFWREVIPDARLVGTFRHPSQVARSLRTRDAQMSIDAGLELWRAYNERLLDAYAKAPFPIVSFDLEDDQYRKAVDKIATELGLTAKPPGDFFEASLRTPEAQPIDMPEPISSIYDRLIRAAAAWTP